jgi:hypothetical protein
MNLIFLHGGRYMTCSMFQTWLPPPPAEVLEGEDEYEVDAIVAHRHVGSRKYLKYEYLVHWKGYSSEHDTWEGEENLTNAPTAVKRYWDAVNKRAAGRKRRRGC